MVAAGRRGSLAESTLSRVTLQTDVAVLEAWQRFEERVVQQVSLDGAGQAVVTSTPSTSNPYGYYGYGYGSGYQVEMAVLDVSDLAIASSTPIAGWANLRGAMDGQALFQVSGGVLTMDITNPASPEPQAFFATAGWPERFVVDGDTLLVAAGRYGIYTLDLTTTNLMAP